jgi:hypothetical protein
MPRRSKRFDLYLTESSDWVHQAEDVAYKDTAATARVTGVSSMVLADSMYHCEGDSRMEVKDS